MTSSFDSTPTCTCMIPGRSTTEKLHPMFVYIWFSCNALPVSHSVSFLRASLLVHRVHVHTYIHTYTHSEKQHSRSTLYNIPSLYMYTIRTYMFTYMYSVHICTVLLGGHIGSVCLHVCV